MENNPLERFRRSKWALPIAMGAALVVAGINELGHARSMVALDALFDRGAARQQLHGLVRQVLNAETGQRGYLLTAREAYRRPYEEAVSNIEDSLQSMNNYYASEPATAAQSKIIEEAVRQKLSELATTLSLHDQGKHDQWHELMLSDIGKDRMDKVLASAQALLEAENKRIAVERGALVDILQLSRFGVNVMTLAALMALFMFLRQTRALDQAQQAHAQALQLERSQLEAEVGRRTAELTELAQHLQTAREDERSHLARELHDELGALLTAAKLDTARLRRSMGNVSPDAEERLKSLNSTLNNGIALKRRITEDLRPSSLSNLGLVAALEIQAREFAQRAEIPVHTELSPVSLGESAQITLYRLVQESFTNIAKYARASEVTVSLRGDDTRVHVEVRDNGVGFDMAATRRSAHGLKGMHYRVEAEGGVMQVLTEPGRGTRITAWLPMPHV